MDAMGSRPSTFTPERLIDREAPGWEAARQAWNLASEQRPDLVAYPESTEEVVELVRMAAARGLGIAPQGTGHGAGPLSGLLEGTILLNTSRMRSLDIDPQRARMRVGAGVQWAEVQAAGAPYGLAGLAGSAPDVGVVGYSLGGGLGWLGRKFGLACNSVVAARMVLPDGCILEVDAVREPELFWALRGGGGGLGIVTELEFGLHAVPRLYAGDLFWPMERAAEILGTWCEWTAALPDTVTSVGRLLNLPPLPQLPDHLRGKAFVLVETACLTTKDDGIELMRPLRDLGPAMDTMMVMDATGLGALHMDPPQPSPALIDGNLLRELPQAGLDALLAAAGPGSGSRLLSVEIRHLGGALAIPAQMPSALPSLDAAFAEVAISMIPSPEMAAGVLAEADRLNEAIRPWTAERQYLNFAERASGLADLFPLETCDRLGVLKARLDPKNVIRATHPIPG
jgi:hypothetical protein